MCCRARRRSATSSITTRCTASSTCPSPRPWRRRAISPVPAATCPRSAFASFYAEGRIDRSDLEAALRAATGPAAAEVILQASWGSLAPPRCPARRPAACRRSDHAGPAQVADRGTGRADALPARCRRAGAPAPAAGGSGRRWRERGAGHRRSVVRLYRGAGPRPRPAPPRGTAGSLARGARRGCLRRRRARPGGRGGAPVGHPVRPAGPGLERALPGTRPDRGGCARCPAPLPRPPPGGPSRPWSGGVAQPVAGTRLLRRLARQRARRSGLAAERAARSAAGNRCNCRRTRWMR